MRRPTPFFIAALVVAACQSSNAVSEGEPLERRPSDPDRAKSSRPSDVESAGGSGSATARTSARTCASDPSARAIHVVANVSWPDSLGLLGGSGKLHVWSRVQFKRGESALVTESTPCGADVPAQTTTAVAGSYTVQGQVPYSAFDSPHMPKFRGTATRHGPQLTIHPITELIGIRMDDPDGPWPATRSATQVESVDADGDGKPGITVVPRRGPGFGLVPTSIFQNEHAEELYSVQRTRIRLHTPDGACEEHLEGRAELLTFDTLIIGCRVAGRGACTASEVQFLNDSRPVLELGSAAWTARPIPDSASCAEVRSLTARNDG